MNHIKYLLVIFVIILFSSCAKEEKEISNIKETRQDLEILAAYKEAYKALDENDPYFAAKKFLEAELLFPQSEWAPRSALMAAYSYYYHDYYFDAISELERFIKKYPKHERLNYAHFLLAICYYEQIVDEKKDLQSIIKAKQYFEKVTNDYPKTSYALDSKFKIDLINDLLASKEMYIGRYYFEKKKWIPAINRFKTVVDNYETTIYAEEALHRLVEVHYTIGLKGEAKKYAKVLGYNYQSSEWYKNSYSLFDKKYKIIKKNNIKRKSTIKKIKSLFDWNE